MGRAGRGERAKDRVMLPLAAASPPPSNGSQCSDSFLALGAPMVRPSDVARGIEHTAPERVVRISILVAPNVAGAPIVGYLYITSGRSVFFGTRRHDQIDPAAVPLIREIYAASSTATASQLNGLLAHQNGNAILYLAQPLRLLKRLGLGAVRCIALPPNARG